jgi:N-acetylmuramoyl-L-alanine amidase
MRKVTTLPVTEMTVGPQWNGSQGNWDTNRQTIVTVVIHTMVGTVQSANARFNDPASEVSAHYGVGLDGTIYHWVDETLVAYHAGTYGMNQISIGIEHEDNGNFNDPRPNALYTASAKLVADICHYYNIAIDRNNVKKHSECSSTACPDALDIDRIVREASARQQQPQPPSNLVVKIAGNLRTEPNVASAPAIDPNRQPVALNVADGVVPTGRVAMTAGVSWSEVRLPAPSPVHGWFPSNDLERP